MHLACAADNFTRTRDVNAEEMRHEGVTVGSFRLKLVGYFLLLALIPLAGFFWGFRQVAARSETRAADARLQAGLRASGAALQEQIAAATLPATELAGNIAFTQAVATENRRAIGLVLRDNPDLRVEDAKTNGFRVGSKPSRKPLSLIHI